MIDSPYIEACCRLNERFPHLRHLWHLLWRVAARRACSAASVPPGLILMLILILVLMALP
jgi:hypothetical protein